jgi:hypothetical protein
MTTTFTWASGLWNYNPPGSVYINAGGSGCLVEAPKGFFTAVYDIGPALGVVQSGTGSTQDPWILGGPSSIMMEDANHLQVVSQGSFTNVRGLSRSDLGYGVLTADVVATVTPLWSQEFGYPTNIAPQFSGRIIAALQNFVGTAGQGETPLCAAVIGANERGRRSCPDAAD